MNCQNVDKLVTPIGKEKEYQVILFLYPGNYLGVNGLALAVVLALALQAIFCAFQLST
jgi:hypothetical protein